MRRKDFLKAGVALPVAALAGGAKVGADDDAPFTHTNPDGERLFGVGYGAETWSTAGVYDAETGEERHHVTGGNWDAPWLDVLTKERSLIEWGSERVYRPFVVRFDDGREYRSAS